MNQIPPQSPLDTEPVCAFIKASIEGGETNATIVRRLAEVHSFATTKDSVRRFRKRHGINIPGVEQSYTRVNGDRAEGLTSPRANVHSIADKPRPVLDDPDKMLEDRGLDPEEWYIDAVTVNEWDGPQQDGTVVTYYQAKFTARRKRPVAALQPVRSDGWRPPKAKSRQPARRSDLVVICGDDQAPFHDRALHELFCQWLACNQPDRGVHLGDLMDFPTLSRHKPDPANLAKANECMQSGYDIFRARIDFSPLTTWDWLPGNHDIRLYDYEAEKAPESHGIKTVDTPEGPGEVAHCLAHLLRLDELGVNFVDPHGSYEDAQVELSKNLAVRHGWIARKDGGKSALETLRMTGYSILIGHTHRQSLVQHTVHEIDGAPRQLLAAEIGCMCRIDKRGVRDEQDRRFPNYTTLPNWQQGFATAQLYPDGRFKVDLATYVNGVLFWRDQRYE